MTLLVLKYRQTETDEQTDTSQLKHCCLLSSIGKNTLYLSTHDKEAFYRHLGYTSGPIVSPVTRISKLINPEQVIC
jgi:hypothetical protein